MLQPELVAETAASENHQLLILEAVGGSVWSLKRALNPWQEKGSKGRCTG